MIVKTDYLGDVEYDESAIVTFEDGLYGFHEFKKYIVVNSGQDDFPFSWLQSIEDEDLSFIITQPFLFVEDYSFDLPEATTQELKLGDHNDVVVYTTTAIPDDIKNTTINLKAPIIINSANNLAKQVVLDGDYPFKHTIFNKIS